MRRAAKADRNQPEIVAALRKAGCMVAITSTAGNGFPDLVVGRGGVIRLIEIKDGEKVASARKLKPMQVVFHEEWKGLPVHIVESVEQALLVCT